MIAIIQHNDKAYKIDLSKPLDISMPLKGDSSNPTAWYVGPPRFEPVMTEHFTGDVNLGGAVNFRNIFFNPHGNGTHTECVGHISKEQHTINQCLKEFFFFANVVSITPEIIDGDSIITLAQIEKAWTNNGSTAVVIRTIPNTTEKLHQQYSNTNPTFVHHKAIDFLLQQGVDHLLIDTPSVDKEEDGGELISHHVFWQYPENPQTHRTITELIFVPDAVIDGQYFLNIQIASFENDASPSKPILFKIEG